MKSPRTRTAVLRIILLAFACLLVWCSMVLLDISGFTATLRNDAVAEQTAFSVVRRDGALYLADARDTDSDAFVANVYVHHSKLRVRWLGVAWPLTHEKYALSHDAGVRLTDSDMANIIVDRESVLRWHSSIDISIINQLLSPDGSRRNRNALMIMWVVAAVGMCVCVVRLRSRKPSP